jgi:RNA polymerase sigma-70 factor, ECF subfamily
MSRFTFQMELKNSKDLSMPAVISNNRTKMDDLDVPENELVSRARSGDARSFELLFDHYYDMIHVFAYRVCLGDAEADDIAQETFIRAARGISGYRGTASFKNWLYRIAHNAIIDWGRHAKRQREGLTEFTNEMEVQSSSRISDFSEVHRALKELSPDLREAVALVYFEEMNHREAAETMGCAETTVSWRIFRAKHALKKVLGSRKGEAS